MEPGQRGERRGEDIADTSSMVCSTSRLGAIVAQADPLSSSSNSYHVGQNPSQNRQDVVKIFRFQKCIVQGKISGLLPLVSESTQQEAEQYGI